MRSGRSKEPKHRPWNVWRPLRCIGKLPDGYRAVLNLFAVEGYSHREIAEMLGVSEGTSRSQYLRAKGCLLKILKEEEVI